MEIHKTTAIAPSNIAFIKYWGKKDEILRLPENGSLSMNLNNLLTTTTVEFSAQYTDDYIEINGTHEYNEASRGVKHLDRIRNLAGINYKAKVITKNNFPTSTGLSSSASGFAALTLAASKAAGLSLDEKELSILARQGSGSACRSIPNGFVEWLDGDTSETSYAESLFPPDYWDLADLVAVVSEEKKDISTTEGQKLVDSSPFFMTRKTHINERLKLAKKLLADKNFPQFGELIEAEALELHAIMLTSRPSLIYWSSGTLKLMKLIKKWRTQGIQAYFTINTGQDLHIICLRESVTQISERLSEINEVKETIINYPFHGAHLSEKHLF